MFVKSKIMRKESEAEELNSVNESIHTGERLGAVHEENSDDG